MTRDQTFRDALVTALLAREDPIRRIERTEVRDQMVALAERAKRIREAEQVSEHGKH